MLVRAKKTLNHKETLNIEVHGVIHTYTLYAVVNHKGNNLKNAHYTATIKVNGKYYFFNRVNRC